MTLYADSSAVLKRYFDERDSDVAIAYLDADPVLVTSRLTEIEVRRTFARDFAGTELAGLQRRFQADLDAFALVALDGITCSDAARIAEQTGCRSLDAIHLACARRAGPATTVLTFDIRQAQAARMIDLHVVGV